MDDSRPPCVVDRYFQKRYKTDIQGNPGEDQLILTHSNRICVICIAQSHPIISEGKIVSKVSFRGDGWSRMDNVVTGKSKRGAQWLERMAPLCCVTCNDNSVYTLCCCLKGQLVEINTNLETTPSLLTEKPSSNGYLAVILPGLKHFNWEIERLKSEDEYKAILEHRSKKSTSQNSETLSASGFNTESHKHEAGESPQKVTSHIDSDSTQSKQEVADKITKIEEVLPKDESHGHSSENTSQLDSL